MEKNSLWKNIRNKAKENKRTGATPKEPTRKIKEQGEKIKANSKMMGGMLPDISKMKYGGKMKNC